MTIGHIEMAIKNIITTKPGHYQLFIHAHPSAAQSIQTYMSHTAETATTSSDALIRTHLKTIPIITRDNLTPGTWRITARARDTGQIEPIAEGNILGALARPTDQITYHGDGRWAVARTTTPEIDLIVLHPDHNHHVRSRVDAADLTDGASYIDLRSKMFESLTQELDHQMLPPCPVPGCQEKGITTMVANHHVALADGGVIVRGSKVKLCGGHSHALLRGDMVTGLGDWLDVGIYQRLTEFVSGRDDIFSYVSIM